MQIELLLNSQVLQADDACFARVVRAIAETLILANRSFLKAYPSTPPLYESGVVYLEEPPGVETAVDIPTILYQGGSDCLNLCAWRVAELRQSGEDKRANIKVIWKHLPNGSRLFHVQVRRGNGKTEDPSKLLGM